SADTYGVSSCSLDTHSFRHVGRASIHYNNESAPVVAEVRGLTIRTNGAVADVPAILAGLIRQEAFSSRTTFVRLISPSIQSSLPRKGWRIVIPILPPAPPRGKLTAIIRPLTMSPLPSFL